MKVSIDTAKLQVMVSRLSKGLSHNKFLPYTGMLRIDAEEDRTRFSINDGNNAYSHYLSSGHGTQEVVTANIDGEKFFKLIRQLTTKKVTIKFENKKVVLTSNGKYSFNLESDTVPIKRYPEDVIGETETKQYKLPPFEKFKLAQSGLSKLVVNPLLMGYYLYKNHIVTTNGIKLSVVTVGEYFDEPLYLTTKMVELLATLSGGKPAYISQIEDLNVIVTSTDDNPNKVIYGPQQPGKEQFENYEPVMSMETEHSFTVVPNVLGEALQRVNVFSNGTFRIVVKEGNIFVATGDNNETTEDVGSYDDTSIEFVSTLNIDEFIDLVSVHTDELTIGFTDGETPISLNSEGIVQIIAPLAE